MWHRRKNQLWKFGKEYIIVAEAWICWLPPPTTENKKPYESLMNSNWFEFFFHFLWHSVTHTHRDSPVALIWIWNKSSSGIFNIQKSSISIKCYRMQFHFVADKGIFSSFVRGFAYYESILNVSVISFYNCGTLSSNGIQFPFFVAKSLPFHHIFYYYSIFEFDFVRIRNSPES